MDDLQDKVNVVIDYISKEHLDNTFHILINQKILCEARSQLIRESCQKLRSYIIGIESSNLPEQLFIDLHVTQLDLVSKLFMLMEDYLYYSRYLRINLRDLPNLIISGEMRKENEEINHLKKIIKQKSEFSKYFLLPEIDKLSLSRSDKKYVRQTVNDFYTETRARMREIVNFFNRYYGVYIRYKHVFSAYVASYSTEHHKKNLRIFIRDRFKSKDCTYVLPSDFETLEYYENLNECLTKLFSALLECYIYYIQNRGKPFLLVDAFFLADDKKKHWSEIVGRVNSFSGIPQYTFKLNVKEHIRKKMIEKLSTEFIFVHDKDILKHEENRLDMGGIRHSTET